MHVKLGINKAIFHEYDVTPGNVGYAGKLIIVFETKLRILCHLKTCEFCVGWNLFWSGGRCCHKSCQETRKCWKADSGKYRIVISAITLSQISFVIMKNYNILD